MFSRQQDAKRRSKEVSLALDIIGFSPTMVRWRQMHYDTRIKTFVYYGSKTTSPSTELSTTAFHVFLTGSKQEGTSIWDGGDEDFMIVCNKYVCVHDSTDVTAEPDNVYIGVEDIKDEPGYMFLKKASFTRLNMDQSVLDNLFGSCVTEDNYFSSQMINKLGYCAIKLCENTLRDDLDMKPLKRMFFETTDDEYPSIVCRFRGLGEHTADIVLGAFVCKKPSAAILEWASRKRYYNWPSNTVIDRVVNMPSYVVPKGCKESERRGLEFRISYTLSEVQLIKTLNETQMKIYILLKLLFQSEVDKEFPDIITSYCLKNVVFWLCEKAPVDRFVIESLLEWLKKGLVYILDCVKEGYLPMYLVPKRNLLEGKLNTTNKPRLKMFLSDLIKEGPYVLERVQKIKIVVKTLRSDIVVAMAMGYILHRGEMALVNRRDEGTNCEGQLIIPAWSEKFYTTLLQVKDFLTLNSGMREWLTSVLRRDKGSTLIPRLRRLLGEATQIRSSSRPLEELPTLLRGATQAGNSSSPLEVLTGILRATQTGSNNSSIEVCIDEKRQDPEKQKHNPDEHKQERKEMHDSEEQKHNPAEQKRIIEDCKRALEKDPSNKEAYIKMGMAHTALGKNWEAADCYREALERDAGSLEVVNKLNEVSKLLQEEAAYSGFDFGSGEGQRNFSCLFRVPSVKKKEKELLDDEEFLQMMAEIMSGEKSPSDPTFTGLEESMQQLLHKAKELAKVMEAENPQLVADLRTHGPDFFLCQ